MGMGVQMQKLKFCDSAASRRFLWYLVVPCGTACYFVVPQTSNLKLSNSPRQFAMSFPKKIKIFFNMKFQSKSHI